ncbi:caspase family protein [Streptomyces alboflavus]|uniref:caspase family protein n=1 Tax=Streptomyces alboflavus TaxID=67267 RepID=UPI003687596E
MGSIFAFLAGVNAYDPLLARPLRGCVNDVTAARELLTRRTSGAARTAVVCDGEVTVDVVEDGIRRFLGAAGPGDTALFWFSGHGTHTWATGADLLVEATGRNQALLCADGPLPDKRLGALLDAVAARGAHVAAVLDCCFSGGATREPEGLVARFAPPVGAEAAPGAEAWRPRGPWAAEARDVPVRDDAGRHVLLAASRLDQLSYEGRFSGRPHGAFTYALLGAVRDAGPDVTYRNLLAAADARVQRGGVGQQPVLYPAAPGGVADLPFLGGAVARAPGPYLLRLGTRGWEVDCGTGHGLRDGAGAEGTEFRVVGDEGEGGEREGGGGEGGGAAEGWSQARTQDQYQDQGQGQGQGQGQARRHAQAEAEDQARAHARAQVLRAREVYADRTLVDPVGWEPVGGRVYPVALSALALAPATVGFGTPSCGARATEGSGPQHPSFEAELRQTLATSGPGNGPSPLLRLITTPADTGRGTGPGIGTGTGTGTGAVTDPTPEAAADLHFRVEPRDGLAHILRRDDTPFTAPLPLADPGDVPRVVDCLAHLTRWHQIRDLAPRPSVLDNLVQVEIAPWGAPPGQVLVPNGSGEIVCAYGPEGAQPREPWVTVRLHNRSPGRTLWCLLLDLTDSYGSHSALFPGHFIGPGRTGHALDGEPVQLSLPASRPAVPGASARDWLKLVVAEGELNTVPFHLPAWDAEATGARDAVVGFGTGALRLDPPGGAVGSRDLGSVTSGSPGRWTARTISLRTVVPD